LIVGKMSGRRADTVRGGRYLAMLAGASLLAAGCGTTVARTDTDTLAAAVAKAKAETTRIAITTTMQAPGMSVSFTQTGEFDFAHSRGLISMQAPMSMTAVFVPPRVYIKLPAASGPALPKGKSWLAIPTGTLGGDAVGLGGPFSPFGVSNPADLLASLMAISGSERNLGAAIIRGVPVTGFQVNIDPAKAAARVPDWERASFQQFAKSLGSGTIPVDVWVDGQNQVRRVRLSLSAPEGADLIGAPGKTKLVVSTDYYDIGVPVNVSAPPAAEVASLSQLGMNGKSGTSASVIVPADSGGSPQPPAVSGSLTPAQAAAAVQAVGAFWAALGHNDPAAAGRLVPPAQRSCVSSLLDSGPKITVSKLRIISAKPAGSGRAAVRFTVSAKASLGGQDLPLFAQGPGTVQWLVTTQIAGHWYVDLKASTGFPFAGFCS
jgi:hypothetical protein